MSEIFRKLDNWDWIHWDWILGIEELDKASPKIKKLIAEQFEKKYEVKFWKGYWITEKEFDEFLWWNKKVEENKDFIPENVIFKDKEDSYYLNNHKETVEEAQIRRALEEKRKRENMRIKAEEKK